MTTAYERKAARPRLDSLRSNSSILSPFPRPPSPTFSQTTQGSLAPGGPAVLINRSDLRDSLRAYEDLMDAGKAYRRALIDKSNATANLASAMEACSRLKGSDHSGPGLQATAGFHYVVSSSEQILADAFYKNFEIPLLHTLDTYRQETIDRQASYEQALVQKTKLIRETEAQNLKQAASGRKGKGRDLNSFRKTLELLQAHVHELDQIKLEYHGEVLDAEDEIWETILGKIGMVVKTQLEVFDRIQMKANDPVLEPLLAANPDPFEAYSNPDQDAAMFSILPPIGILQPTSSSQNLRSSHSSPLLQQGAASNSQPPSQPTTPRASDSPALHADSPDGFLSPRRANSSIDLSDDSSSLTPRKSTFSQPAITQFDSSSGLGLAGGLRKVLSVIGESNARTRNGDDDDGWSSTGDSTIGRNGVGEELPKKKERGSIPFPHTPSQESLRVGNVVGDEEQEQDADGEGLTTDGDVDGEGTLPRGGEVAVGA